MSDGDQRTIHRLEAFSDIVIGFCLAELGLNLVIPKDPAGLAALWPSLNAFAFSFVLISMLWWFHHKLFTTYLRLNPAVVVMNFVLLAALVFGVYFQQVAIHFVAGGLVASEPLRVWLACMALIYGLLAGMYAIGIWERRHELDALAIRWGASLAYQTALGAVGLAGLCFAVPDHLSTAVVIVIVVGVAAALRDAVASRLSALLLQPR